MNAPAERWDGRTATWIPLAAANETPTPVGSTAPPESQRAATPGAGVATFRPVAQRSYHSAQVDRLTLGWRAPNNSADSELYTALRQLRGRSRDLIRNAGYAKRAKEIVVDNVIGGGVGMQGNVRTGDGKLTKSVNDGIETAFCEWSLADSCHTGGALHFSDFERACMGQVFEAGEVFIRLHFRPFGNSKVPLALELVEAERLADDYSQPVGASGSNEVRMGVEVDTFGRAVAYWVRDRHPSEIRYALGAPDRLHRIPADQMMHLRIVNRWPQTRGEPWLHTAARRLNDMDGYSEAEIVAARGAAAYMAFIKTPDNTAIPADFQMGDQAVVDMSPGVVEQLPPGWDIVLNNPNRPNPNMDPFMRLMLREVAAGAGTSYESLSRDYSQSNYSSSRLALLDDRDRWRALQQWWIRAFRHPLHRVFLRQAVLATAVPGLSVEAYINRPAHYEQVKFKPRGWSWVDPTKEVAAFKEAVRGGFMTVGDVIAQTANGRDLEDTLQERESELEAMSALGLKFDTDIENDQNQQQPAAAPKQAAAKPDDEPKPDDDEAGNRTRVVPLRGQANG